MEKPPIPEWARFWAALQAEISKIISNYAQAAEAYLVWQPAGTAASVAIIVGAIFNSVLGFIAGLIVTYFLALVLRAQLNQNSRGSDDGPSL